ncbi:MAG: pyridoxamine 5'-phosphate oxidase family protein [Rhizobacter sp.]|nr:pyridoxamine 5'-phosphate oxidase family protein [Ferruginibacter sp.]
MATISLSGLAKQMKELDICMMITNTKRGGMNCRPMSNNRDVTYKGDSYFFTYEQSAKIKELEANPAVCLSFEGKDEMYISVAGKAKLIRKKQAFGEHWQDSLAQWFKDGIDTKGMVLVHVKGSAIKYWQREKQGSISLAKKKRG